MQGSAKESHLGAAGTDYTETASFHRYIWANYLFTKWKVVSCAPRGSCGTDYFWSPTKWAGQLTDNNPNPDKTGAAIGIVGYTVPTFDTNPNDQIVLTQSGQSHWHRNTAQVQAYGFEFSAAGFLGVSDKASLLPEPGSITVGSPEGAAHDG